MKKLLYMALFLLLSTDIATAYESPKGMADVLRRDMNLSLGEWINSLGHVAMYQGNNQVLEVSNGHGSHAIQDKPVSSMMSNGYQGTRYGKANSWQGKQVIKAGQDQKESRPHYTVSPYYREGGWGYTWKWSWRRGFYKKWHLQTARFRCDSFVNYCYKKGTGRHLVERQWMTIPDKIYKALPYKR